MRNGWPGAGGTGVAHGHTAIRVGRPTVALAAPSWFVMNECDYLYDALQPVDASASMRTNDLVLVCVCVGHAHTRKHTVGDK